MNNVNERGKNMELVISEFNVAQFLIGYLQRNFILYTTVWSTLCTAAWGFSNLLNEEIQVVNELMSLIEKTKLAEPDIYGKNIHRNKAVWETYYDCLNKQLEASQHLRSLPIKALAALEGGTVKMNCSLCASPSLFGTARDWYWFDMPLPEDDWTVIDRKTGDLSIFGVRLDEGGMYECRLGKARSVPYLLQVLPSETDIRLVKGRNALKGPKPIPEEYLPTPETNYPSIRLYTDWSAWSECSRCDEVGLRYRFGSCMLSISNEVHQAESTTKSNSSKRRRRIKKYSRLSRKVKKENTKVPVGENITTKTHYSTTASTTKGSKKTSTVKSTGEANSTYLLELFFMGIPCNSPLLSQNIRRLSSITKRKNEIMEGFCKPPCADTFFEVKDKLGKILERANNSGGVFSAFQGPPPVPPLPSRQTLFVPVYEPVIFGCPGHLHRDVPFRWTVNRTKRLIPAVIANQTKGRVTINFRQQISFKEVEPEDGRLYVCWQLDSIAGVVRLVPFDPAAVKIDHHLMLIGITIILGTFAYVFARIYMNRKRAAVVN